MLNCIAVDDEPLALALLEDNITKVPNLHLMATCRDAFEATKVLQENNIDLVFIDIQMPGLTGLQFIKTLAKKPMVILITAYKQYALDSYDLDVVDYLVKPVAIDRFMKACNKAAELHQLKAQNKESSTANTSDHFFLSVDYSLLKVFFNDILYIESLRDYVKVHLKSTNKPIVARMTLRFLEEQLPQSKFIRIHKSYLLSIDSISAIRKNSVFIKDIELPVGETYRDVITKLTGKNLHD
ncbi:LytTR family DNA-binding domain-containing protein [Segetibacter sp.]|jgi:two-component system LytT family response regulator|uniref:LytR/AlgR family response regulator transcription factor n=1 Tax=Segetibacter sp. TaxID=2231182 RepID=UPI00262A3D92|nr:LytTR family DNA-binding domain-containing protein [Segetibacter sp.]